MFYNPLTLFRLLLLHFLILNISSIGIYDSSSFFYRQKHKKIYDSSNKDFTDKNNDIFIEEPNKNENKHFYRFNEINDTNFNFSRPINKRDIYVVSEDIIRHYEDVYIRDKLDYMITKTQREQMNPSYKINEKEGEYPINYIFYANKNYIFYDKYYTWHKLISRDSNIIDYLNSPIKHVISTSQDIISITGEINQYHSMTFKIENPGNNNLNIKEVKTDLYQIKLYPYIDNKYHNFNSIKDKLPPISSFLPFAIYPSYHFIVQLSILPDKIDTIRGTLYIEFNNKQVYMLPIILTGIENKYKSEPLYIYNWPIGKIFVYPIKIHNPEKEILSIKEISHTFKFIQVLYPNDILIPNNCTNVISSMMKIQYNSTKNLIYIKFVSNKKFYEYGLLTLKTEKDSITIPILINAEINSLIISPSFINFGICDITPNHPLNIKKLIPISIKNIEKNPLKIFKVYLNYEEKFIQFRYNYNSKYIILKPNQEYKLGYIIFNANLNNYLKNLKNLEDYQFFHKIKFDSIYIKTNSTRQNMIQIFYSYYLDSNTIEKLDYNHLSLLTEKFGIHHFNIPVELNAPFGLERHMKLTIKDNNNIKYILDRFVIGTIKNPNYTNETYKTNISLTIGEYSFLKYERYYFLPLYLNFRLYSLIPFKVDNNNIDFYYCETVNTLTLEECIYSNDKMAEYKNIFTNFRSIIFNVGILSFIEAKKFYFYFVNENEISFKINSIESDNNFVTVNYENYDFLDETKKRKPNIFLGKINLSQLMFNDNKVTFSDNDSIELFPYSAIKFSFEIFPEKEGIIRANLAFTFSNSIVINILIFGKCYKGKLNIGPSIVRFDPSFPGLSHFKYVNTKSSYSENLFIKDFSSTSERIIPKLISNKISANNRTLFMKIIFDPSKANLEEDFMMDLNPNENYITYRELYLWKQKQQLWEKSESLGKTEINANITIKTEIDDENIRVKAFLNKPSLVKNSEIIKNNEIDLKSVQIGQTQNIYFEIYNPSDEVMSFKLMLASEEYSNVYNNSMFENLDEFQFNNNNKILILKCYYENKVNGTFSYNFTNDIIINDIIDIDDLNNRKYDKTEFMKEILNKANNEVKKKISEGSNIICKYKFKLKNEILLKENEKNKFYISKLFSSNFLMNIPIIEEMTDKKLKLNNEIILNKNYVFEYLKNKIKDILKITKKQKSEHPKRINQSFFLDESIPHRLFTIQPKKKHKIGPIIFHPFNCTKSSITLFIKNNLTILYPIKIKGEGGSGIALFSKNLRDNNNIKMKLINNSKIIIDIDKEVYEEEIKQHDYIKRSITFSNNGTLPLFIHNISIENSGCEAYGIKISQCGNFNLKPTDTINIEIIIIPDFTFYSSEKEIFFYSNYHKISLKIIINIQKDILSIKNKLFYFFPFNINFTILSLGILFLMMRVIFYVLKKEIENKNNNFGKIEVVEYNSNEYLIYENLFINCYKKEIKGVNEDLTLKKIDKLNEDNISNLKRNKRRRSNIKSKRENVNNEIKSENKRKESLNSNNEDMKITNLSENSYLKENKNIELPSLSNEIKAKKLKNQKKKNIIGMENDSNNEEKNINNDYYSGYISANNQYHNYRYNDSKYSYMNYYHVRSNSKFNHRKNKRYTSSKMENQIPFPRYYKNKNRNPNNKFNIQLPFTFKEKKFNQFNELFSTENTSPKIEKNQNENINPEKDVLEIKSNASTPERIINDILNDNLKHINNEKNYFNFENQSPKNHEKSSQIIENEINPIFLSERRNQKDSIDTSKKNINEKLGYEDSIDDNNKKHISNYDSSNEASNFNVNKIISESFSGNEFTDEELNEPNTQIYFKKLLNNTFQNNKVFYSDPFRHSKIKGKLDKLLEDKEKNEPNKIIEKEDEEWSDDDDDESSKFKLNEMNLDFNLNFK